MADGITEQSLDPVDFESPYEAWLRASPLAPRPTKTELLKPSRLVPGKARKSYVFRMHGVGLDGEPLIAKLCKNESAATERSVYEDLLADMPIDSLRYYGSVADEGSAREWLFLEDAGHADPRLTSEEVLFLASEWIGRFHALSREAGPGALPVRNAAHFLGHLLLARRAIEQSIAAAALSEDDLAVLRSMAANLALVESEWGDIERECARAPHAIVHGDYRGSHIVPRDTGTGTRISVLDWEMAGWGPIGLDVATIKAHRSVGSIDSYLAGGTAAWPNLNSAELVRTGELGFLLRLINSIYWATPALSTHYPDRAVAAIARYDLDISGLLERRPWS